MLWRHRGFSALPRSTRDVVFSRQLSNPAAGEFKDYYISITKDTIFRDKPISESRKTNTMALLHGPWTLEVLNQCRCSVEVFKVVPEDIVEELYGMIGGVPGYFLEKPKDVLNLIPGDTAGAKKSAYARVLHAINLVRTPLRMMQCFEQGKDSSRLLHRWPTDDHQDFRGSQWKRQRSGE
ncbi:hypothetical protein EDD21DRAFT_229827 [Dissophora ornata]|nr:hypothetical protein EDD21DRAFT_229827 [Dissophora ornata]